MSVLRDSGAPRIACYVVTDIETDGPTPGANSMRIFVSHPLTFDGVWIDWYLRRFAGEPLFPSLFDENPLFFGDGIDLPSLIAGRLGVDYSACVRQAYPSAWFGGHRHTHKAVDDASGYASVLRHVLAHPDTPDGAGL